jgi:hypothetical protein
VTSYRRNTIAAGAAGIVNSVSLVLYLPAALWVSGYSYSSWLPTLALLQLVPSIDLGLGASVSRMAALLGIDRRLPLRAITLRWSTLQILISTTVLIAIIYLSGARQGVSVFLLPALIAIILLAVSRPSAAFLQGTGNWTIERMGVLFAALARTIAALVLLRLGPGVELVRLIALDVIFLAIPGLLSLMAAHHLSRNRSEVATFSRSVASLIPTWVVSATPLLLIQLPVLFVGATASTAYVVCLVGLIRIAALVRQGCTWITEPAMREIQLQDSEFRRRFGRRIQILSSIVGIGGLVLAPVSSDVLRLWLGVRMDSAWIVWSAVAVGTSGLVLLQSSSVLALAKHREVVLAPVFIVVSAIAAAALLLLPPSIGLWCWAGALVLVAWATTLGRTMARARQLTSRIHTYFTSPNGASPEASE